MTRFLCSLILLALTSIFPVAADTYSPASSGNYIGSFTYSTLPPATIANFGSRASISDLGGDPGGEVRSTGTCWKRVSTAAVPASTPGTAAVSLVALQQSSLIQLTSTGTILGSITITITGACPGDTFRILFPSGLMTAASTVGISINSAAALSNSGSVSGSWGDYTFTGTSVVKIAGGQL